METDWKSLDSLRKGTSLAAPNSSCQECGAVISVPDILSMTRKQQHIYERTGLCAECQKPQMED